MLGKIVLCLLFLVFSVKCIVNKTDSTDQLPLFSSVNFVKDQIFFISKGKNNFGYISKTSGLQSIKFQLQLLDKLISSSSNYVIVSSGERIAQFNVQNKYTAKSLPLYSFNISMYQGYHSFKYGYYVLADNRLVLNQWKSHTDPIEQISLNLGIDQTVKQMEILGINIVLLTKNQNEICLIQVQKLSIKNRKCFELIGEGEPKLQIVDKSIFIIYNNIAQLFNQNFQLVQTFNENILQICRGFVSFINFRTYNILTKNFQNFKIVCHDSQFGKNKLQLINGQYILKQDQNIIVKISNLSLQPVGIWLNKRQAAVGRILGKYELLVQFNTGSVKFYQIKVDPSGSTVVEKWSK